MTIDERSYVNLLMALKTVADQVNVKIEHENEIKQYEINQSFSTSSFRALLSN